MPNVRDDLRTDDLIDPRTVTLIYRDAGGTDYEQVLADVPRDGTLIDPDTGDDLDLVAVRVGQASPAMLSGNAPASPPRAEPTAPQALDPLTPVPGGCRVNWTIDADADLSPARAAANAWRYYFHRGSDQPTVDEGCVFTVTRLATGAAVDVDLSDPRFAALFD